LLIRNCLVFEFSQSGVRICSQTKVHYPRFGIWGDNFSRSNTIIRGGGGRSIRILACHLTYHLNPKKSLLDGCVSSVDNQRTFEKDFLFVFHVSHIEIVYEQEQELWKIRKNAEWNVRKYCMSLCVRLEKERVGNLSPRMSCQWPLSRVVT
jgi:hypothetical protein